MQFLLGPWWFFKILKLFSSPKFGEDEPIQTMHNSIFGSGCVILDK